MADENENENVKVEIRICSYHMGEICGVPTIYLTHPPIKGEPTCEMIKRIKSNDKFIYKKGADFFEHK